MRILEQRCLEKSIELIYIMSMHVISAHCLTHSFMPNHYGGVFSLYKLYICIKIYFYYNNDLIVPFKRYQIADFTYLSIFKESGNLILFLYFTVSMKSF